MFKDEYYCFVLLFYAHVKIIEINLKDYQCEQSNKLFSHKYLVAVWQAQ